MTKWRLVAILIGLTFIAYFSSFGNPFIWDDEQFITNNVYVGNFDLGKIFTTNTVAGAGVQSNYYRPLTTLSFALDSKIWGVNPFGFHLTNTTIHITAGIVLFLLLLELGIGQIGSFFITLFFLIHPIQTEAVTYINSRGDSLYTLFLFSSLLLFTKLLSSRVKSRDPIQKNQELRIKNQGEISHFVQNDKIMGITVVFLFILSLLSKEIALAGVGLYIAVFALQFFRSKKVIPAQAGIHGSRVGARDDKIRKGLFLVLAITLVTSIYLFLRLTVLRFGDLANFYGYDNEYTRSLAIRLFTFCKVIWVYLGLLVWPNPLHMERTVDLVRSILSPWVFTVLGAVIGMILLGLVEIKKKGTAWILFGLSWFLIMLVPSSGIIPINGILYEHWLYVSMIGFFITVYGLLLLTASACRYLHLKIQNSKLKSTSKILNLKYLFAICNLRFEVIRKMLILLVSLLSIMYLFLTIRQNNLWADPITFYSYTLSFASSSARLHNNLGISYADAGNREQAIQEYKKAIALIFTYPEPHNNLGNAYRDTNSYQKAEEEYEIALQLNPYFTVAKLNLIKLYVITKQWDKAIQEAKGNGELIQEIGRVKNQQ